MGNMGTIGDVLDNSGVNLEMVVVPEKKKRVSKKKKVAEETPATVEATDATATATKQADEQKQPIEFVKTVQPVAKNSSADPQRFRRVDSMTRDYVNNTVTLRLLCLVDIGINEITEWITPNRYHDKTMCFDVYVEPIDNTILHCITMTTNGDGNGADLDVFEVSEDGSLISTDIQIVDLENMDICEFRQMYMWFTENWTLNESAYINSKRIIGERFPGIFNTTAPIITGLDAACFRMGHSESVVSRKPLARIRFTDALITEMEKYAFLLVRDARGNFGVVDIDFIKTFHPDEIIGLEWNHRRKWMNKPILTGAVYK